MGTSLLSELRGRSLRAQLQLMMLALLGLSVGSLFVLHLFGEQAMLGRIRDYTEELSTAIEITQEQPGGGADLQKAVRDDDLVEVHHLLHRRIETSEEHVVDDQNPDIS